MHKKGFTESSCQVEMLHSYADVSPPSKNLERVSAAAERPIRVVPRKFGSNLRLLCIILQKRRKVIFI